MRGYGMLNLSNIGFTKINNKQHLNLNPDLVQDVELFQIIKTTFLDQCVLGRVVFHSYIAAASNDSYSTCQSVRKILNAYYHTCGILDIA